ncbi:papain-like cysteine protease family protein [Flammeovirga sp. SJP92]|uniref:papain-like cysteine protease family protein n=1 Tax=Flammeovirga sp. SJP92 TaxID=1775430 RepID=UPI000787E43B|nr:papain-like cysteine protease family protein [Flammeovirga sp. SJP92]KXX66493.1 hypothetical protein AVL50_31700 [Flammeovirga sp. SJP92]
MRRNKLIIKIVAVIVFLIMSTIVCKIYFSDNTSLSYILEESDFSQTSPPNNLIAPGTIALVEEGKKGVLKIICPCENALGDSIRNYFIKSPSADINLFSQLEGDFSLDLSFMNKFTSESKSSIVKKITLKLSNVKILELPDDAVFKNIKYRSPYCTQAINKRLASGKRVTMIKRVIQADAEYIVDFEDRLSQSDTLNLMKNLALELTGGSSIKEKNIIIGKNLFWGVDDDIALGNLKPNELPSIGSKNRPRLTQINKAYKVEYEKVSHSVSPIKQPSAMSCWIATYTMMLSWKEQKNYKIEDVLDNLGEPWKSYYYDDTGLPAKAVKDFLLQTNLNFEPPASYTLESYINWLKETGPLWIISGDGLSSHAKLLVGIYGDNSGDISIFEFIDPETGKIQRMEMMKFISEYEKEVRFLNRVDSDIPYRIQIIHFK